jgi:hypothetical protein
VFDEMDFQSAMIWIPLIAFTSASACFYNALTLLKRMLRSTAGTGIYNNTKFTTLMAILSTCSVKDTSAVMS